MIDGMFNFSGQQALTGTAATASTNVVSAAVARKMFGGAATTAKLAIQVTAAGGTTPTFSAKFVGADNAALTTNPVTIASVAVTSAIVAADLPMLFELLPGLQRANKAYYGVVYTLGGTSPTATVNAFISTAPQSASLT